jgi:NinB protein
MNDKQIFKLVHSEARSRAAQAVMQAPEGYVVRISPATRSLDQNALMWKLLSELERQMTWHGQKLSSEDYKDMLTASLRKQRVVPGIDGGFVVFGERTKTYSKAEFSELIELIYAFGTQHGVNFEEKKNG